jgi:glycosyltransferase involved in cell wall biosynthesis
LSDKVKYVSVLMPAFNCAGYIRTAINSVLNQTFKEFELIIIDDGSTDSTAEIVDSISKSESRVIYRRTANRGTAAALNYGLSLAGADWVARIDADDINVPARLERQVGFIDANPEYDIISSWSVYFADPAKILFPLREPVEHEDIYLYLDLHNPLNQSSVIYRKSIITAAGYNEKFRSYEDFELFHRIRDTVKFYNIPEFLTYTRVRQGSKTFTDDKKRVYDFLFPNAFKNMIEAKSKGEHFYWAGNIAWINFFFGARKDSRSYLKSSFSLKNSLAYATTFLPDKYFNKLIDSRMKYRIINLFRSNAPFKKELVSLLQQYDIK